MLQGVMTDIKDHPLSKYLKEAGETVSDFAERLNMSRTKLYRIMNGENTTRDTIKAICDATGGNVPISAFFEDRGA